MAEVVGADNVDNVENFDTKYQLILTLINKILVNIDKPQIKNLTEFKDIVKSDIVSESNLLIVNSMEDNLYKYFDKKKSGYYQKNETNEKYVLNCLRATCKQIGFKLIGKEKGKRVKIDGQSFSQKYFIYRIEKSN